MQTKTQTVRKNVSVLDTLAHAKSGARVGFTEGKGRLWLLGGGRGPSATGDQQARGKKEGTNKTEDEKKRRSKLRRASAHVAHCAPHKGLRPQAADAF